MSEWKEYKLGEIADITSSKRIFIQNMYLKEFLFIVQKR